MARFSWLAVLAAVAAAGPARAEVVATFIGTDPFQTVNVAGTNSDGTRAFQSPVGPFNFLSENNNELFSQGDTFRSFCSDYFQDVSLGNSYTYTVVPFADLPDVAGNPTKMAKLQELFNRFYDVANTDATGAAFQLAVWEILYDPTNTDLSGGNFTAVGPGDPTGISIAQGWLNTIGDSSIPDPAHKYDLIGLYSATAQDQILVNPSPVPAPAGVVLLVIGAGALIARRRFAGKKDEAKTEAETETEAAA